MPQCGLTPLMQSTSPAASTSALPPVDHHDADKISAYYSLAFPNFTYYLQTLTVTIGRRPIPSAAATAAPSSDVGLVDVDLGPLKSVSRLHARIEYEEEEERFVLAVLGRNGAWVDGIWAGCGSKVPLGARWVAPSVVR
jgi:forkhead box protein K